MKQNIDHYISMGYKDIKLKDVVLVKAEHLSKGSHQRIAVKCDYCGKIVYPRYKDFLKCKHQKYACEQCRQRRTSDNNLPERQEYLYSRALDFCNENGYTILTPKEDIKDSYTHIKYLCPKHGINDVKIYALIVHHKCPYCAIDYVAESHKHDIQTVTNNIRAYGGELTNPDEYINCMTKNLNIRCPLCGEPFLTSYFAFTHRQGQFCSRCSKNTSKGELKVKSFLDNNNVSYIPQYRFADCRTTVPLPFDFYLDELNVCIEYDGVGHYKKIPWHNSNIETLDEDFENMKKRDTIKTNYCLNNGIKLIRIPYWDYEKVDDILKSELFTQ